MADIWFTSDTHYGHANIIKYCARPFADVHEMNKALTEKHNAVVRPGDIVYHLGDFSFAQEPARYLRQLHGQVQLILGNHDKRRLVQSAGFAGIHDTYLLKISGKVQLWLSHYAHRVWPQSHYGAYHLYGHSHGKLPGVGRSIDVGVDAWEHTPVHLETIITLLESKPYGHGESKAT